MTTKPLLIDEALYEAAKAALPGLQAARSRAKEVGVGNVLHDFELAQCDAIVRSWEARETSATNSGESDLWCALRTLFRDAQSATAIADGTPYLDSVAHLAVEKARELLVPETAEHDPMCDSLQLGPELEPSTKPCNCRGRTVDGEHLRVELAEVRRDRDLFSNRMGAAKSEADDLRAQLAEAKAKLAEFEESAGEAQGIDEENHGLRLRVRDLEDKHGRDVEAYDHMMAERNAATADLEDAKAALAEAKNELSENAGTFAEVNREIAAAWARVSELSAALERRTALLRTAYGRAVAFDFPPRVSWESWACEVSREFATDAPAAQPAPAPRASESIPFEPSVQDRARAILGGSEYEDENVCCECGDSFQVEHAEARQQLKAAREQWKVAEDQERAAKATLEAVGEESDSRYVQLVEAQESNRKASVEIEAARRKIEHLSESTHIDERIRELLDRGVKLAPINHDSLSASEACEVVEALGIEEAEPDESARLLKEAREELDSVRKRAEAAEEKARILDDEQTDLVKCAVFEIGEVDGVEYARGEAPGKAAIRLMRALKRCADANAQAAKELQRARELFRGGCLHTAEWRKLMGGES